MPRRGKKEGRKDKREGRTSGVASVVGPARKPFSIVPPGIITIAGIALPSLSITVRDRRFSGIPTYISLIPIGTTTSSPAGQASRHPFSYCGCISHFSLRSPVYSSAGRYSFSTEVVLAMHIDAVPRYRFRLDCMKFRGFFGPFLEPPPGWSRLLSLELEAIWRISSAP
jgi:hypothetical protein